VTGAVIVPGSYGASGLVFDIPLREPTLSYIVLWLADAMGGVAFDDASVDGIGKDATKKTHGARGRSRTAPDDRRCAQLLCLDRNPRLSRHDILEDLVEVGLGEVLDPPL
jgi:hypothetical protein